MICFAQGEIVKSIADLQQLVHTRYLAVIAIERFVQSNLFAEAYDKSTDIQKSVAIQFINDLNKKALVEWTRSQLKQYNLYEVLPTRDLRVLCQDMGISCVSRLSRLELLSRIKQGQKL